MASAVARSNENIFLFIPNLIGKKKSRLIPHDEESLKFYL